MMAAYLHLVGDWESPPGSGFRTVDPARRAREDALEELYSLSESGEIDDGLDYLYDTIDDLLLEEQYDTCDAYLKEIDIEQLDPDILVGLLTITYSARDQLRTRGEIFQRISALFEKIMDRAEMIATLRGLEQ